MNSLLAVFRFELRRILTPGRAIWWLLVAGFPMHRIKNTNPHQDTLEKIKAVIPTLKRHRSMLGVLLLGDRKKDLDGKAVALLNRISAKILQRLR